MNKVYRVVKNGVDVPCSATMNKKVAFSHAQSVFIEDPSSIVKVLCTELVESTVTTYSPLNCRLRTGDEFERFTDVEKLSQRIAFYVEKRINFSLIF